MAFIFSTRYRFSLTCTKPKQSTIFRSYYAYGVTLELQELMYPAIDCNSVWKNQFAPMIKRFMQNPHPDQIDGCLKAIDSFKKQRAEVHQHLIDNWPLILEKKTTKADSEYLKKFDEGIKNSIALQFGKDKLQEVDYPNVDEIISGKISAVNLMKATYIIH